MRLRAGGRAALVDQVAEPEEEHRAERVFDSGGHGRRTAGLPPPLAVTAGPNRGRPLLPPFFGGPRQAHPANDVVKDRPGVGPRQGKTEGGEYYRPCFRP